MKKLYFIFVFLAFSFITTAQTPLAQISIESPSMVCSPGQCSLLTTTHATLKSSTDYTVESIPYSPIFPFVGGVTINTSADDVWSPEINLPFNFSFYGNCYNSLLVGSNGLVTFDLTNNNPAGTCPWQFTQTIPNAAFPVKNAIYGVYQDTNIAVPPVVNPSLQNVNYYVLDTGVNAAPNRVFVVNFNELPMFQCNSNVGLQTSQIVIHESTNIIEVFVKSRTACTTWNSGSGLIGLQNANGTAAVVPAARNTGTWSTTNEAWRFSPNGAALPVTYQWTINAVPVLNETSDSMLVCPTENATYQVQMTYVNCNLTTVVSSNSVTDILMPDPGIGVPVDYSVCREFPFIYSTNLTSNDITVLNGLPAVDYYIRYYENLEDAQNTTNNFISNPTAYTFTQDKTIYMVIESLITGCLYVKPFSLTVLPVVSPPTGAPTQDFTEGQTLADLEVQGENITWYDSAVGGNQLPSITLLQDDTTYYATQIVNGCESNRGVSPTRFAVTVNLVSLANDTFVAGVFTVFPNPVNDKLTVKSKEIIKSIRIYNILGQQVLQLHPYQNESQINVAQLNNGVYFLTLDSEQEHRSIKILKK
ncbi:T9SS type A sorting domain-containing protein [Flavobacterium sp. CYK-4]|uniref:T9SS type A sorting domain-containing protein n=1 Tax=Flavobacterium lotistagni TaxID=2709660 RepID=UPI00140C0CB7|nr:T9SS type A sorting domain-containing protein [Flavobacterium lotistagni]NHM06789.1 T9SS type A sorting domain-containing protein [Flavobacterium lotistagni]